MTQTREVSDLIYLGRLRPCQAMCTDPGGDESLLTANLGPWLPALTVGRWEAPRGAQLSVGPLVIFE